MEYQTAGTFRRALEDRLLSESLQSGVALVRLRKMVVFDRFLARLVLTESSTWVLKGGLALQLRLGARARTTKDIDLSVDVADQDAERALRDAAAHPLGDWFEFEVATAGPLGQTGSRRYRARGLLDSRLFEAFHVDVGIQGLMVESPQVLKMPAMLAFAGIPATAVGCYPITMQIAEKLRAYTRPHPTGEGTRAKDLVDILLMTSLGEIDGQALHRAIVATFTTEATHQPPGSLPNPPVNWSAPFRRLAGDVGLEDRELPSAMATLRLFLDPILAGMYTGTWDPASQRWVRAGPTGSR